MPCQNHALTASRASVSGTWPWETFDVKACTDRAVRILGLSTLSTSIASIVVIVADHASRARTTKLWPHDTSSGKPSITSSPTCTSTPYELLRTGCWHRPCTFSTFASTSSSICTGKAGFLDPNISYLFDLQLGRSVPCVVLGVTERPWIDHSPSDAVSS
jgi:hypothetical protein